MPTELESVYSTEMCAVTNKAEEAEVRCIIQHDGFEPNFINHHVVELAVFEYNNIVGPLDDNDEIHK